MSVLQHYIDRGWSAGDDQMRGRKMAWAPLNDSNRDALADCECNKKPASLIIYACNHPYSSGESYEVEVCGERGGIWLKLNAYCLTALEDVDKGITAVCKAWNAGAP